MLITAKIPRNEDKHGTGGKIVPQTLSFASSLFVQYRGTNKETMQSRRYFINISYARWFYIGEKIFPRSLAWGANIEGIFGRDSIFFPFN